MAGKNQLLIEKITAQQIRKDLPNFQAGDTINVHVRIKDGDKERIQKFEGVVIKRQGEGIHETFTVRKISTNSVGVERTFPTHTPTISLIELIKKGRVRRAKINYLRERSGKSARIVEDTRKRALERK